MLTEEYVDSWNKLFPDCRINNYNLDNPTEDFLVNALVCYLRRFGFDIEPPIEKDNEARKFLINLSQQIDNFLKITDKRFSFTYYDLIKPTPKKTAHTLYILLNYYYYYNVYKEDVFKIAGEKIRTLEELKDRIDKTRCDNNHIKEENFNTKLIVESLMKDIPLAGTKLKELDKKSSQQYEEYERINHFCQELKEKLKHLEEQKKILSKGVVDKEEILGLQNHLQQLKIDLTKQKQIELTNDNNLVECKESNASLLNLSEEVKRSYEVIPLERIKEVKESNEQMVQNKKNEKELKLQQINVLKEIDREIEKKLIMDKEILNIKVKFTGRERDLMTTLNTNQNKLQQKLAEALRLEKQDHSLDCRLEELKDIEEYLAKNIAELYFARE